MTEPTIGLGEPGDLTGFPTTKPPKELMRVCRTGNSTWWFSCDGSGRFDLAKPEGTCYLATDSFAAVREVFRGKATTPSEVRKRELRRVVPPDAGARLAATTYQRAGRYGMTTELATERDYGLPQRWAAAFRAAGFAGIRHELRHDPRARASGIAVFGPAGAPGTGDGQRTALTVEAVTAAGIRVLPVPRSAGLTIEP